MEKTTISAQISEENSEKIESLVDGDRSRSDIIRQGVAEVYEQETGNEIEIKVGRGVAEA
jgi:Arc/MetJ-type ribon-helix-helix transcriptional regulator